MKYMHSGHFLFGGLLLTIGMLIILNSTLGLNLPMARTIMGLILLYFGLSILGGSWGICTGYRSWNYQSHRAFCKSCTGSHRIRKENAHIRITDDKIPGPRPKLCFDTRAGQTTIDLTPLTESVLTSLEKALEIRSRTRVGQTIFMINRAIPIEIHTQTGWGDTHLPDGTHKTMGQSFYRSHVDRTPLIIIYTEVRMGNIEFKTE